MNVASLKLLILGDGLAVSQFLLHFTFVPLCLVDRELSALKSVLESMSRKVERLLTDEAAEEGFKQQRDIALDLICPEDPCYGHTLDAHLPPQEGLLLDTR